MIFIAIGSSIGDAEKTFLVAEKLLADCDVIVTRKSKIMKNPPAGGVAQNEFSNAVWELGVPDTMVPHELLAVLKDVEEDAGRNMTAERWSDRVIDLDLIIFHDEVIDTPTLTVPHPRMDERDFVLQPLAELIDENFEIPTLGPLKSFLKR